MGNGLKQIPAFFLKIGLLVSNVYLNFAWANTFIMPPKDDLIGEVQYAYPEFGETLSEVGIRFNMGLNEMLRANPKVSPINLLPSDIKLLIPSQFILPPKPHTGLIINLAEYRLYYFPPHENIVITMPIGIGREGWTTPLGGTHIIMKQRDPVWHPTNKLIEEANKQGKLIADELPSGEGNPLGRQVLRLGWPTYLIHGSNRRDGVGTRVSAGCIRLLSEDMEYLFSLVTVGTVVRVINEPVKLGYSSDSIYIQIFPLLSEQKNLNLAAIVEKNFDQRNLSKYLNNKVIKAELNFPSGIPKKIS